jgi:lambda repressor-like predicted transcriptional regulator
VGALRQRLLAALGGLLDTIVNPRTNATVRDELAELGGSARDTLKAQLSKPGLENEKIAAETLHILEKAREIRARTQADIDKSTAETERINLDNLDKKIALVEKLIGMAERMEANAVVDLLGRFAPAERSPAPQRRRLTRGDKPSES